MMFDFGYMRWSPRQGLLVKAKKPNKQKQSPHPLTPKRTPKQAQLQFESKLPTRSVLIFVS